jgi:histidinol dehydrogenase
MLGIPARLAGCPVRILVTPPGKDGAIDPYIIVAAQICGIDRIYKVGGAQAIAALAYGTATIPKVDKIFGPGNSWVTEAKAQVASDPSGAACDMPAGPSEVMVVADDTARSAFIAADLLSQAEHGPDSQVVLVSPSLRCLEETLQALGEQLLELPRREIASKALSHGRFLLVRDLVQAMEVANLYAPEHLILQAKGAPQLATQVLHAGSVFLGPWSPEAAGDYASGTNHVLPTYGFARAFSGVSVDSFVKQITFQELSPEGLKDIGPTVERLAELEGLHAHARAVSLRLSALEGKKC